MSHLIMSVVTLPYYVSKIIGRTLKSIDLQVHPDYDIVTVNNDGIDGIKAVHEFSWIDSYKIKTTIDRVFYSE